MALKPSSVFSACRARGWVYCERQKLFWMARSHSISTTSWALAFPNSRFLYPYRIRLSVSKRVHLYFWVWAASWVFQYYPIRSELFVLFLQSLCKLFKNVRWSYYWATDWAAEVGKPSRSFLLANAVNHANPEVITFPVVHNKPTWCYPLNTKNEYADWTYSQRIPSTT